MSDTFNHPIAYLTGEYPRATDTFIQREVAELRARGHQVETCSVRRTGAEHLVGEEQKIEAKNTFYILAAAKSPVTLISAILGALLRRPGGFLRALLLALRVAPPGLRNHLYQLFYFAEAAVLAAHLRKRGVRHLHNHIAKSSCTVAMLTSELSGIPFSFTLHGPDIFFAPDHWRLDEKIARARFVACISQFCRSQAMAFCDPKHWGKLHIVHCGVDPLRYDGGDDPVDTNLLFVGRLAPVKGLPILLRALEPLTRQFPDIRLTVVGDGPGRTALEHQVETSGLAEHVRFVGYKSQTEVAEALKAADLFVLPSFAEGVPVVLMEAMAARRPVVATQIAGIPELVADGGAGLLVPPGDVAALSAAISKILANPARATAMGIAGRAKVEAAFDITKEAARLSDLFQGQRP
ncbi:glycosyltransferase family 4 protein [Shimia marina]|uniref:GDP-mannose-dependent alpha-(1-6)-phosphatidylinositol monomannoside mannosyltransferase n=1 Tax=Shimia marina TaxID=321267 RepID=A0A0P1EM16_9RHOB|nr:glycosyltransferase family 4 protein [Shimia marina]CUH51135.1 GDP-mannose-dependent alpha-(1-6)-phosphatidylinositol monomannoside mannosyltransferase [Shimia marina]SFD57244.1 Glycosyltransferase involved in cell wall bisynthesis [Shimia marina]